MRTRRESFREWAASPSFQIVAMPSVLALIGLYVGDTLERPALASILTIVVAAIAFLWYWAHRGFVRRSQRLGDGSQISAHKVDGLLTFVSSNPNGEVFVKVLDAYQPKEAVLMITDQTHDSGAQHKAEAACAERKIDFRTVRIASPDHLNPSAIERQCRKAVSELAEGGRNVAVDITGGTSVLSIGLYQAAVDTRVIAGYLDSPQGLNHSNLRLIYEPSPEVGA